MKSKLIQALLFVVILYACSPHSTSEDYQPEKEKLFTLLAPKQTGVKFQNPVKEDRKSNHLINDMLISGAGVTVGDINNDGLPDLFFTGNQVQDRLYLNKGKLRFEDITEKAGILAEKIWSSGATMADVNGDGHLDIYVCKYVFGKEQLSENLLYINNGDLTFTEKAKEYRLADRGFAVQATFFDFDLDGLLDLYLVNQPPSTGNRRGNKITLSRLRSRLYTDKILKNNGDGTFFDATNWCGVENLAFGLSATVADFDNNNMPDIYVANDYEKPDHLYLNKGSGQFRNATNHSLKHISNFSMGADVADFDNDGYLDIMVVDMVPEDHKRIKTNMGGMQPEDFWEIVNKGWHFQYMFNTLQRNNGNGTFSEIGQLAGVSSTDWSWAPLFADFDNDGWKDLFITNGVKRAMRNSDLSNRYNQILDSLELVAKTQGKSLDEVVDLMKLVEMAPTEKLSNYAFKNNGDLTFSKKAKEWGLDLPSLSFGSAYADLDLDGDIDLIVNNTDEYAHIYRNNASEKGLANYLRIQIVDEKGMPAYGARAKIYKDDEFWQMAELTNTRGYKSKSEDILHFGLSNQQIVDKIEITYQEGGTVILEKIMANQVIKVDPDMRKNIITASTQENKLFRDVTRALQLDYVHHENEYNDYDHEILLPHKMSNFGPGLAVGDVNGDGLEDVYIGGAAGFAGKLFLQQKNRSFQPTQFELWEKEKAYEDLDALLFDVDQDQDLDLYVVSGGNEFEVNSSELEDRLYINNGQGIFQRNRQSLPMIRTSGSCVKAADYDEDGDLDLFIGGRVVPGKYPIPANSHLLQNNGGRFVEVTDVKAPMLRELGLVTAAEWTDFSGDGRLDLVIVGEWMPIKMLENKGGNFVDITEHSGLSDKTGWYYGITTGDFDQDGDQDLVVGNLGLNYKYKASSEEPFEVYSHDFDQNGHLDIVLGYHEHGEIYPLRGRSCSSQQMPQLAVDFPTFESFGEANLRDVYGEGLDQALHYQATTFASAYIENLGDGSFKFQPLPNEAQFSSVNNIIAEDFNADGHLDLLISGNLYPVEIETPRNDAGMGLYLTGNGKGQFEPIPTIESGFFAPHDAKDMTIIEVAGAKVILVANNQNRLQAIKHEAAATITSTLEGFQNLQELKKLSSNATKKD